MEIARFKNEVKVVEQALGVRLLESRRAINDALTLRGGDDSIAPQSWADWGRDQRVKMWTAVKAYGKTALEKAQVAMRAYYAKSKQDAKKWGAQFKVYAKKKAVEAKDYTWKQTKRGGKWAKKKAGEKLTQAKNKAKQKACEKANKACASESIEKSRRRWRKHIKSLMKTMNRLKEENTKLRNDLNACNLTEE